jgi:DNA-binding IclR family transcriptional regulator
MERTSRNTSVEKAFILLNCFTEKSYHLTLDDIAKITGFPRSTVFRMLTSLESFGYIKKTIISKKTWYSLGYTFLEKGFMVHRNIDIRKYARDAMVDIRNDLNMNVQLAIQDGMEALYIEQIQSWRPIRLYPSIGRRAPLYVAACPRVLLAFLDGPEQDKILEQSNLKKFTSSTPQKIEEVKRLLEEIKERHYSYSYGELFEGTIAIAVPVFYPSTNNVIAALSIVGLETDFEKEYDFYLAKLKKSALEISQKIMSK